MLLSVLKNELPSFPQTAIICEIGSGSGILSAHVSKWLKEAGKSFIQFATDLSLDACLLSQKYYEHYGLDVEQVCTSLLKGLRLKPDIIICNPPYVPTDPEEKESELKYLAEKLSKPDGKRSPNANLIAFSYMGGPEGLDTTRQLISSVNWNCKLYLIVMGEDGLNTLQAEVLEGRTTAKNVTATFEVLQFMKKMNEELYVVAI